MSRPGRNGHEVAIALLVTLFCVSSIGFVVFHHLRATGAPRDPVAGETWTFPNSRGMTNTVVLVDHGMVLYSYDRGRRLACVTLEDYHRSAGAMSVSLVRGK